ncbi:hypothetical protein [Pseudoxanthomonas sp.]|uniref:hypothetical protein n=1 Tax=Pseudoxanthomonas sp. TaxID=1871049 RepID=UPI00262B0214|nr:hypothetical protein [Pseudoxanthomonas sp.]WDS36251.1 MAG: hypothetical protein O8I58_18600 [Pseudoxanthomonas sp.]
MTLPKGFRWEYRWQYSKVEDGLFLDSQVVAMLLDKVGGGWFARLDCQKGIDDPLVTRPCASFDSGKAGCEAWVIRHEARLRAEVAEKIASRPKPTWSTKG